MRARPLLLLASALLALALARPARAELVVFADGGVMKVASFEAIGEQARLTLLKGGRITVPIERVERVVDDEVEPEPDPLPPPPPVALAAVVPPPVIPLRFDDKQAVPEGPYGALIFAAARKHAVNPQVVAAL